MAEPHGRRATLERRIRLGNIAANTLAAAVVVCVLMATAGEQADLWLIAAVFSTAAAVTAVRLVSAWRIELFQLGAPGPSLVFSNEPEDEEWN